MKKILLFLSLIFQAFALVAQAQNTGLGSVKKNFVFDKQSVVNFDAITEDFMPSLLVREMPKPGSEKMVNYFYPYNPTEGLPSAKASIPLTSMVLGQNFFGNPWSLSTPNDNDLAISDSGFVVSVANTNIYVKNTSNGAVSAVKSLAAFTTPLNNYHEEFDPKVMYDPQRDRFVLMCMVGFVDTTSKMIVGFSQTNNPNGNWNLYTIPGNPLNNNLWSDYPMIALTEKELFLSVNLLTNNSSWQTGFVETLIWQIKKDNGYAGLPLSSVLHSNILFGGAPVRNLCPVKGGSQVYGPNMYFVSNRNFASQNDTVFLVNVTDTIGAATNTVTVKALISNQPYYFPPGGRQVLATQTLATNDSRNLGAFYENNKIQYVHNTKNPVNNQVSVYYGIIDSPSAINPTVTGYIIPNDTMDFAYPNISYAGKSGSDNTAIITFDHSSNKVHAGCSAIKSDAAGNFSDILRVKNGLISINLLTNNLERWGDYSGSQRRYNKPGEVWLSGYYSYNYPAGNYKAHGTWVAQIFDEQGVFVGLTDETKQDASGIVYPNPAHDMFTIDLNLSAPEYLSFELYAADGKLIKLLLRDWVKVKQNAFSFNTHNLEKGIYVLKITGNNTKLAKKIVLD